MTQEEARDFVKYSFFKVAPQWRSCPGSSGSAARRSLPPPWPSLADRIDMSSYSLVGTGATWTLCCGRSAAPLEAIDELMAQLNRTELAGYLHTPHSYLAMTAAPLRGRPPARGAGGDHRHHAHRGPQVPFVYPSSRPTTGTSSPRKSGSG